MALPDSSTSMTEAEYLEFERQSDVKHNYRRGQVFEVFAMTGASRKHNLICSYTLNALINALGDGDCEVYPSGMRVKAESMRSFTYPDISVVCGEAQFLDGTFDTLLNPVLIVEVLSPSTERFDRSEKFQDYRRISSLKEYVLISQEQARVEVFQRQEEVWLYRDVDDLGAEIALSSLDVTLALSDIYKKVTFEDKGE